MKELITVEFEERHGGQTAAGVADGWFKRVEPFRQGDFDDPEKRSEARRTALMAGPGRFRNVELIVWDRRPE